MSLDGPVASDADPDPEEAGERYAQNRPPGRGTTRGIGPGARPLSDPEPFRVGRYDAMRPQPEAVDPKNPELQRQYLTGPEGFVPTQEEVEAPGRALESARALTRTNASTPPSAGPVNQEPRASFSPDQLPPFRWATTDRPASAGTVTGPIDPLEPDANSFAQELATAGNNVRMIPRSNVAGVRTADMEINGTVYEYKNLSNSPGTNADSLSSALRSSIQSGVGQSANVIVDARNQVGMTRDVAIRGISRAYGSDNLHGQRLQSVTVLTPEGAVHRVRIPQ